MGAAMNGNVEVMKLLLCRDVKINQQDAEGQTALMYAAHYGHPAAVELLLSQGAKTEIKDQFGRTALTVATIQGKIDVVRVLLAAGANPHCKDIHNLKPIVYASAFDQGEIYTMLKTAMSRKSSAARGDTFRRSPLD
jgi:ankyrin repeat protein